MNNITLKATGVALIALSLLGSASLALANDEKKIDIRNESNARVGGIGTLRASTTAEIRLTEIKLNRASTTAEFKLNRASTTEAIKEKREEKRTDTKVEIKTKIEEQKKQNVLRVITNRAREFRQAINQLTDRFARLTRISAELKTKGFNTSVGDAAIRDGQVNLALSSTQLNTLLASSTVAVNAKNPGQALQSLKTAFDGIRLSIKAAHKDVEIAISSFKGMSTTTASTSASTTNQ